MCRRGGAHRWSRRSGRRRGALVWRAPQTSRAAEGIGTFDTYAGPTSGFAEQVYLYELLPDDRGRTLALLYNASGDRGCCVRFDTRELPCFTVWKNTLPVEEGYVTGLEPATNFPNFKTFERTQGRVKVLRPTSRRVTNAIYGMLRAGAAPHPGVERLIEALRERQAPTRASRR